MANTHFLGETAVLARPAHYILLFVLVQPKIAPLPVHLRVAEGLSALRRWCFDRYPLAVGVDTFERLNDHELGVRAAPVRGSRFAYLARRGASANTQAVSKRPSNAGAAHNSYGGMSLKAHGACHSMIKTSLSKCFETVLQRRIDGLDVEVVVPRQSLGLPFRLRLCVEDTFRRILGTLGSYSIMILLGEGQLLTEQVTPKAANRTSSRAFGTC